MADDLFAVALLAYIAMTVYLLVRFRQSPFPAWQIVLLTLLTSVLVLQIVVTAFTRNMVTSPHYS